MSENSRAGFELSDLDLGPGPYLARVVNHLDPTYMGSLEVTILREIPGKATEESSSVVVRYCSPFFGSTAQKFEGNDSSNFGDVQKSYGMWMVPPDIGCTVMVMFVGGKSNQGYWFGCIPDLYQNHMVPGIAASQYSAITPEAVKQELGQTGGALSDNSLNLLPYTLLGTITLIIVSGFALTFYRSKKHESRSERSKKYDDAPPEPGVLRESDSKKRPTRPDHFN